MRLGRIFSGLCVLACVACLAGLGLWQLQRLQWKTDLLARLQQGMEAPAAAWNDTDKAPEFTHVKLEGGMLRVQPVLYLYGRTVDGVAGVHVITLYRPHTGRAVIVDRGFVPTPIDVAKADAPALSEEVDGIVRAPSEKAWFELQNNPGLNQWYWMDLPAMATALDAEDVSPVYVEALKPTAAVGGPLPTGDRLASNLPNNHLQYAITWFSLASALLLMYALFLLRANRQGARRARQKVEQAYAHHHHLHPHYHEENQHAHDKDKHKHDAHPPQAGHHPHGAHLSDLPFPDRRKTPRS